MKRLMFALAIVLSAVSAAAQSLTATVAPFPRLQFLDNTGVPLAGGSLYTYVPGTNTPQQTCATQSLVNATTCTTPLPNPITLDSAGRPQTGGGVETAVYLLPQSYKFILQNASGVTVWTQDNVQSTLGTSSLVAFSGTVTYTPPTVLMVSSNTITPTQNVHGVDTSGGAQNLNTIATTNVSQAFVLFLFPNNASGNPVTVKNGAGNITLTNGDAVLNNANAWIQLVLRGSTWYEVSRNTPFQGYTQAIQTPAITSNVLTVNYPTANVVEVTLNANITTMTLTNVPASGFAALTFVVSANGSSFTWSWLTSTVVWASGVAPTVTTTNGHKDMYTVWTDNGGSTWHGVVVAQDYAS